jgi:hypothetical protein
VVKYKTETYGEVDLKLGSKGSFTGIFTNTWDKERAYKEDPYFFNSVALHLKY